MTLNGQVTDENLLFRFASTQNHEVFHELVSRHSGMVLGVCLRVLRHQQDAEDAYQATFLILARDAKKIRQPDSLASWLYGVAYRTSMKARDRKHRRRECDLSEDLETKTNVLQEIEKQHLHHTIDEELTRLPKKYRDVVVHKFLENKSTQQVADSLGLSHGAVKGRIERAKKHLRHRLLLRGCSLGVALVSIHESQTVAAAAVSQSLIEATSTAGMIHQAGQPLDGLVTADAISLASKEISTMVSSSVLKCGLAALLLLAILAGLGVKSPIVAQKVDELTILPDTADDTPGVTPFRLVAEQTKRGATHASSKTKSSKDEQQLAKAWQALSDKQADLITVQHLKAISYAFHGYLDKHDDALPPAVVPNPALPPEKRLSGLVLLLPHFADRPRYLKGVSNKLWLERRVPPEQAEAALKLYESIDLTKAWDDPVNLKAAKTIVPAFLAPHEGNFRDAKGYAVSHFAFCRGNAGRDDGAFTIGDLVYIFDPEGKKDFISDGTVNTLGIGQIHSHLGPWIAAGTSSSRYVYHQSENSKKPTFGSHYGNACYFATCDAAVRFIDLKRTSREKLYAWVTRSADEPIPPGEINEYATATQWKKANAALNGE